MQKRNKLHSRGKGNWHLTILSASLAMALGALLGTQVSEPGQQAATLGGEGPGWGFVLWGQVGGWVKPSCQQVNDPRVPWQLNLVSCLQENESLSVACVFLSTWLVLTLTSLLEIGIIDRVLDNLPPAPCSARHHSAGPSAQGSSCSLETTLQHCGDLRLAAAGSLVHRGGMERTWTPASPTHRQKGLDAL